MIYLWIGIIVAAIIAEAATAQLVSIWFVAGGIAGLILNVFDVNIGVQVLVAALITLIFLLATRPFVKSKLDFKKEPTNADRYIGKIGMTVEDIDNRKEQGQVKVLGSIWSARSALGEDVIKQGTEVTVKKIEGVRLFVEPTTEN